MNTLPRKVIALKKGNKEEIKAKMDEYALARKTKQPLEYPSAGSTFKRPERIFCWKIDSGCRIKGISGGRCTGTLKNTVVL